MGRGNGLRWPIGLNPALLVPIMVYLTPLPVPNSPKKKKRPAMPPVALLAQVYEKSTIPLFVLRFYRPWQTKRDYMRLRMICRNVLKRYDVVD